MKRFTLQKTHSTLLFVPLAFVVLAVAVLGIMLVRGYDQGSIVPLVSRPNVIVEPPELAPVIEPVSIADTAQLPETISSIPTPTKVTVTQKVSLKVEVKDNHGPREASRPRDIIQNVVNDVPKLNSGSGSNSSGSGSSGSSSGSGSNSGSSNSDSSGHVAGTSTTLTDTVNNPPNPLQGPSVP